jgi:hypothetical protein
VAVTVVAAAAADDWRTLRFPGAACWQIAI